MINSYINGDTDLYKGVGSLSFIFWKISKTYSLFSNGWVLEATSWYRIIPRAHISFFGVDYSPVFIISGAIYAWVVKPPKVPEVFFFTFWESIFAIPKSPILTIFTPLAN